MSISCDATWEQNGITIAGGHGNGEAIDQFNCPFGIYVDEDRTVFITDYCNHRIVKCNVNNAEAEIVAGGNGQGRGLDQLSVPTDIVKDRQTDTLFICDWGNRRVMRWPCQRDGFTDRGEGEVILNNVACWGLAMDDQRSLYVSDSNNHEVRRYRIGETKGIVVAGGNGQGGSVNQFNYPTYLFVDQEYSIYVSDEKNHRVMKWSKNATEGIIVAGGQGQGRSPTHLSYPQGIWVDEFGTIYVADRGNHRIMRWEQNAQVGTVIVGGNGGGFNANQLNSPEGLFFDRYGHLYVVDYGNHRVQLFNIITH